jgi:hypothetical protein
MYIFVQFLFYPAGQAACAKKLQLTMQWLCYVHMFVLEGGLVVLLCNSSDKGNSDKLCTVEQTAVGQTAQIHCFCYFHYKWMCSWGSGQLGSEIIWRAKHRKKSLQKCERFCHTHRSTHFPGPMLWFLKFFRRKIQRNKLAFLTQNKANLCKILIITLIFEKNAIFSPKIVENRRKLWS